MELKVVVSDVDLSAQIGESFEYAGDDEPARRPVTLGDAVADRIADDLKQTDDYRTLRQRVAEIRLEEIRAQLEPIVRQAIEQPVQQTNRWGDPTGAATTLRDVIIEQAKKVLNEKTGDSYSNNRPTVIEKYVRDAVTAVMKEELAPVIAEEKAKIVAQFRASAANLLADALRSVVGK